MVFFLKREFFFQEMVSALRQLINCYHLWGKCDKGIYTAYKYFFRAATSQGSGSNQSTASAAR